MNEATHPAAGAPPPATLPSRKNETSHEQPGVALRNDSRSEQRSLSSHSADEGAQTAPPAEDVALLQRGLKRERESENPASRPAGHPPPAPPEENPARAATLSEALLVVLSRAELEAAAVRPSEDVHSLARGALVRVRSKDACYALREVYRARLAPSTRPDRPPLLQLQTYQDYETSITAEQVSNSPPTPAEWDAFVADLAESGRRLTLQHVRAVAHNLGRVVPPADSRSPEAARVPSPSSAEAERARKRADRFSEPPPWHGSGARSGYGLLAAAAAAAAEAGAAPLSPASASQQAAGVSICRLLDAHGKLGAIIGSQGATVKAIQSATGATVEKVQERGAVRVEGLPSQVAAACAFILHIIHASSHADRG